MTKYLIYDNVSDASIRNHNEAVARNCEYPTIYWWNQINHPTNGKSALEIPEEDQAGLAPSEQSQLFAGDLSPDWFE